MSHVNLYCSDLAKDIIASVAVYRQVNVCKLVSLVVKALIEVGQYGGKRTCLQPNNHIV